MDQVVRMTGAGGIERLEVAAIEPVRPERGEVRIRQAAIGVNFLDTYHRIGLYPLPSLPAVLGVEGAGTIEAVGDGVTRFGPGDRIAYAGAPVGAYASARVLPAARVVPLPDEITFRDAAASLIRGLTAHMLLTRTYPVTRGTVMLVHAAAGGLGSVLVRWGKQAGATVIGTVSSDEKAAIASANGADHVIVGRDADFAAAVTGWTSGRGADLAIDGIGGETLLKTLACVRPFGTVASIGQAGGPIPPLRVEEIGPRRALSLARHSVMAYAADLDVYPVAARAVFDAMRVGVAASIGREYPLWAAAEAHADLEAGRTTGSSILIP